jgi:RHS repeat-associated protein
MLIEHIKACRQSAMSARFVVLAVVGLMSCGGGRLGAQQNHFIQGKIRHRGRRQSDSLYGGAQPIGGSRVYLFAVSTNGFNTPPVSLLHGTGVTTDAAGNGYVLSDPGGNFNISGLYADRCPSPDSRIYLLAIGGDPGIGSNNPKIALMSALSPTCSNLPNASSVFIGEETTVAAALSLYPFANVGASGISATPSSLVGVNNGFVAANDLVNSLNGQVNTVNPDTASPVPAAKINTLASILVDCINTNGASQACNTLFSASQAVGGWYPSNTLQALFEIAQNPGQNVAAIYGLLPSDPAFTPVLTSQPSDWSIPAYTPTTITLTADKPELLSSAGNNAGNPAAYEYVWIHVNCSSSCGTVEMRVNGAEWGPISLDSSGNAGASFNADLSGTYHVDAIYMGNVDTNAISQSNVVTIVVDPNTALIPTTSTLTLSGVSTTFGTSLQTNAHVDCGSSCWWVYWYLDGVMLGTTNLDGNGTFIGTTYLYAPPGQHTIYFRYNGDPTHAGSTSAPVTFTVVDAVPATLYNYNISSYAPNSNVQAYSDSVNGSFTNIKYDNLNRLIGMTTSVSQNPLYYCWSYDSFGNRQEQVTAPNDFSPATSAVPHCVDRVTGKGSPSPQWTANYGGGNNQVTWIPFAAKPCQDGINSDGGHDGTNSTNGNPNGYCYDQAGNVGSDVGNQYLYDAEGRLCAASGPAGMFQYIYDAEGRRVAKGSITVFSCDTTVQNGAIYNGFQLTNSYLLDSTGNQITELDSQGNWLHTNVYANNELIATYKNDAASGQMVTPGAHYHLADWLGTERVQLTGNGQVEEACLSGAFGDSLSCSGPGTEATEHHFTGKERDTESGLDYFGARYYASNMGRWMSPDWADKPEAVPYSDLANPQSLNLYGYVNNNPLSKADKDGHVAGIDDAVIIGVAAVAVAATALTIYAEQPAQQRSMNEAASSAISAVSSAFHSMFSKGDKAPPNPNGSKGAPDHQATADEEAAKMGQNGQREVRIPTPDGAKGTRVADAATVEGGKVTAVTQVIRPKANGEPPKREVEAAKDIHDATGVQPKLVPVRPLPNQ